MIFHPHGVVAMLEVYDSIYFQYYYFLSPSINFNLGDPLELSNHIKNSSVSKLPLKTIKFRYSLVIKSIVTSSLDYPNSIPSQKKLPARREDIVF